MLGGADGTPYQRARTFNRFHEFDFFHLVSFESVQTWTFNMLLKYYAEKITITYVCLDITNMGLEHDTNFIAEVQSIVSIITLTIDSTHMAEH